jgi:hypothetical protein
MKPTLTLLLAGALIASAAQRASAGDKEWATAGKVLTGLFAAKVIHDMAQPRPVVVYQPAPVFVQPAQVVVAQPQILTAPAPVVVQPQQVVIQPQPVVMQPAPVYVQTAPAGSTVYYVQQVPVAVHPAPVVTYTYGPVCRPRVFIGARW